MAGADQRDAKDVDLLHPFYLDTDMSMAFAAALSGGVALEREERAADSKESEAVRNLRGNLRVFGALGVGGARKDTDAEAVTSESRLVRQHTEASIFIALHDELRRTGRIVDQPDPGHLKPGEIVSIETGPAVAPLRRVVDQLLRLLDVVRPLAAEQQPDHRDLPRQQRRQQAREAAKRGGQNDDEEGMTIEQIRNLLFAFRDDLDRSGMVDIVVHNEDEPSVVLTLDKRLLSDQAIELLHTSRFTVIGKVTQVWPDDEDLVNLYRRSVISLLPALTQTVTWGMLAMIVGFARGLDPETARVMAMEAAGFDVGEDAAPDTEPTEAEEPTEEKEPTQDTESAEEGAGDDVSREDELDIQLGDSVVALNPAVTGPAFQILPLAICA